MEVSIIGAWEWTYQLKSPYMGSDTSTFVGKRQNWAIVALKAELVNNGANLTNMDGVFRKGMDTAVRAYQKKQGLVIDGVLGRKTAKELFKKVVFATEEDRLIPEHILFRQMGWESAWDPAATGWVDPRDRGLAQINSFWHPEVTDEEAFDHLFAIDWTADRLVNAGKKYAAKPDLQWTCAIAAHNNPRAADEWFETGFPPTAQIEQYVKNVRGYAV